jgi:hypothetical protein
MEQCLKVWLKRKDKKLLSAVRPDIYSDRFINFMKREVIVNEHENETYFNKKAFKKAFRRMKAEFDELDM